MNRLNGTRVSNEVKTYFKLYKAGKKWAIAGISLAFGVLFLATAPLNARADTTPTTTPSTQTTGGSSADSQSDVTSTVTSSSTTESASSTLADLTATTSSASSSTSSASTSSTAAVSASTAPDSTASSATTSSTAPQSSAAVSAVPAVPAREPRSGNAAGYSLTLSSPTIGYDTTDNLVLTLTMSPKAGDVVVLTLPKAGSSFSYGNIPTLSSSIGSTTVVNNSDGTITVTNNFTTDVGTGYFQKINLNHANNYGSHNDAIDDNGTTQFYFNFTVNGDLQTPTILTQTISPKAQLGDITKANVSGGVLPNVDYEYTFNVNESNGIEGDGFPSGQVNRASNYGGSTITIPVPTGFVLNSDLTTYANAFSSWSGFEGTTITQPGGEGTDIIITVPAGQGTEYASAKTEPYKIVGHFDVAQTATDQVLTAAGSTTLDQVTNSAGDQPVVITNHPWTETILASGSGTTTLSGSTTVGGNSSASNSKLVLDSDVTNNPTYLWSYKFAYSSVASTTDAQLTITVPDGIDATGLKVPTSDQYGAYLPDVTSYSYTLTLADGTTATGTVNPGETITSPGGAIRTIVLTPSILMPGSYNVGGNQMELYGTLSSTYDNGTAVQSGDQLTSTLTLAASGTKITSANFTQTVLTEQDLTSQTNLYISQNSGTGWAAGTQNSGLISLSMIGSAGQTTDQIYEPIIYYILPSVVSINSVENTLGANVSYYTTADGRTGVKFDFSGTGLYVTMQSTFALEVTLNNNIDALPGSYPIDAYVDSPITMLQNNVQVTDTSLTDGDANAFQLYGLANWNISAVSSFSALTVAQGDEDVSASNVGTTNGYGDGTSTIYTNIVNTITDQNFTNVREVLNLPTEGDANGSTLTFNLTGPVSLPTGIQGHILYATSLQTSTYDPSTFLLASQISDWSTVRAVYIEIDSLPANSSSSRIALAGKIVDAIDHIGDTGYLNTFLSSDASDAITESPATSNATITVDSNIKVTAQVHYKDANGNDQIIQLPDLTKTLANNQILVMPTTVAELTAQDLALIQANAGSDYTLAVTNGNLYYTVINYLLADYGPGRPNISAVIGGQATYAYNGDIVQYELVRKTQPATITYIDETTGEILTSDSITVTAGLPTNYDAQTTIAGYEAAGYVLDSNDIPSAGITYDDTATTGLTYTIKLLHGTTASRLTTNYTVNYTGLPAAKAQAAQTKHVVWNVLTDNVDGTVVYYSPTTATIPKIISPTVAGYTPSAPSEYGTAVTLTDTLPKNQTITVNYTADVQSGSITFHDGTTNSDLLVQGISGVTDGTTTFDYAAQIQSYEDQGYVLVSSTIPTGGIIFDDDDTTDQSYTVTLIHGTSQSQLTTDYTVHYTGLPTSKALADRTVHVLWNVITDNVTGQAIYYGPESATIPAVTSPTVAGYTPDTSSVYGTALQATVSKPTGKTATVNYTADNQTGTVTFYDQTLATTLATQTINGKTGTTSNYDYAAVIKSYEDQGYVLVSSDIPAGGIVFDDDDATPQTYTVTFVHGTSQKQLTTNYTVKYTGLPAGKTIADKTVHVKWNVITDNVTGLPIYYGPESATIPTVVSPTVAGYTPNVPSVYGTPLTASTTAPKNDTQTVNYVADTQTGTVTYLDGTTGTQLAVDDISGLSDSHSSYDYATKIAGYEALGYVLDSSDIPAGGITFDDDDAKSQNYTVTLLHGTTQSQLTTNYTVKYTGLPAGKTIADKTVHVHWNVITDNVTGLPIYYGPESATIPAVASPKVAGYTPNVDSVYGTPLTASETAPEDDTQTVNYVADNQVGTVTYLDGTTGTQLAVDNINGASDSQSTYDYSTKIAGYEALGYVLDSSDIPAGGITFDDDDAKNQNYTVTLLHSTSQSQLTTNYTVKYTGLPAGKSQADKTVHVLWNVITDNVTGLPIYYGPESATIPAVVSPTVAGYTPNVDSVYGTPLTASETAPKDATQTVNYVADNQAGTVTYLDGTTGEQLAVDHFSGASDSQSTYDYAARIAGYEALGYVLDSSNIPTSGITFDDDDAQNQNYTVTLLHGTSQSQMTTNYTVKYTGLPTSKAVADKTVHVLWNVITDNVTGKAIYYGPESTTIPTVASPTVTGYTPNVSSVYGTPLTASETAPKSIIQTVNYLADNQTGTVTYLDGTTGTQLAVYDLNGTSDSQSTYNYAAKLANYEALGYVLDSSDVPANGIVFDDDDAKNQNYTVTLLHGTSQSQMTTNYTVKYTGLPTSKALADKTVHVQWNVITDNVTGEVIYYGPESAMIPTVVSPTVAGYTPSVTSVYGTPLTASETAPQNATQTVNYVADDQTGTVTYVDGTTGTQLKVDDISGRSDSQSTYDYAAKIAGYEALGYVLGNSDVPASGITFDNDDAQNQNYTVTLLHGTSQSQLITNYTVKYTGLPASKVLADKTAQLTWSVVTDNVTKVVLSYTPSQATEPTIASPSVAGYTPDQASAFGQAVSETATAPSDQVANVAYTPDRQTGSVTYVDETTGAILATDALSGVSDEQSSYNADSKIKAYEAQGYVLSSSDIPSAGITFDDDDAQSQNYTVKFTHGTTTKSANSDIVLSKTVTRTIHYLYADGTTAAPNVIQTITFTRTAVEDDVTHVVTYTDWQNASGTDEFAAVQSPVLNGYTADQTLIATSDPITTDSSDSTVNVVYTKSANHNPTPGNNNPTPTTPVTPNQPTTTPTTTQAAGTVTTTNTPQRANATRLPQTGEDATSAAAELGLVGLILGFLGLARRKKEEQ